MADFKDPGAVPEELTRRFTVLLVDDDPDCRSFLRDAIRDLDHACQIIECGDGKQAMDFVFGCEPPLRPDLIFLDMEMPRMGGLEVLEMVKSHPQLKGIPVIILSGVDDDQMIERAAHLGANSYALKAGRVDAFIETVRVTANYWLAVHQYCRRRIAAELVHKQQDSTS